MNNQCPECGSDHAHRSRLRPGERTALNWFLVPLRCRDCKARFWRKNPYLIAALLFCSGLLLTALVWIMVPSDEIIASNEHHDLARATPPETKKVQPQPKLDSNMLNEVKVISEATKDQSTIPNTGPNSFVPNSNDNRLYTVHLYLEKAIKGSADAQYQLGSLYLTGKGTLQDFEEAAKWFTSAAEQNHALAQYELGLLYHNGLGVNPDNEKSYVWLNLAAAAGIEQAVAARDKIMRSLTAKQLAQAQKTAREWLANQKNNSN
ncbi:hypothetical protein SAMN05421754_102628 [Nitrosomonas sp. Nm58]|nr:hypothetical protein SAMN05421754_102628 [Nitrosomonas sp. Nm58]